MRKKTIDNFDDLKGYQIENNAEAYKLTKREQAFILERRLTSSCSNIIESLFGEKFSMLHVAAVYDFMEQNHCFDYCHDIDFHNEVLKLSKSGMDDSDIYEVVKDKYENIGPYQVSAVIIASTKSRRVGSWTSADKRLLLLSYGAFSKKAIQQVFYPRRLTNIQKQASKLHVEFENPAREIVRESRDCVTVGELRKLLEDYNDDDVFHVLSLGKTAPLKIIQVGNRKSRTGENKYPYVTVWNI